MALCEIYAISNRDFLHHRAFRANGVELRHAGRSRSGVRRYDGVVVFGIDAAEVVVDDGGCRCLLWSRAAAEARLGRLCSEERLAHCRLAWSHGSAEGILLGVRPGSGSPDAVALRVQKIADQYWALWGSAGQIDHAPQRARAASLALQYAG